MGGITVVQDPDEAFAPSIPRSAMDFVNVDHMLPIREIALLLVNLTNE
jgi:two-component system, chemotaxis family, protein-glutamate methylesterase/glutaminase